MLAKGRLLGLQFDELFTDGLYEEISAHAIDLAEKLRGAFEEKGYPYLVPNRTNQIFVILPDADLEKLSERFDICYDRRVEETHSERRFCSRWATKEENIDVLISSLKEM